MIDDLYLMVVLFGVARLTILMTKSMHHSSKIWTKAGQAKVYGGS